MENEIEGSIPYRRRFSIHVSRKKSFGLNECIAVLLKEDGSGEYLRS
ncbi:MAG: hypothetical protein K9M10_02260 [Candidatus Pacebacteria bacterium]|nr:hypothetical protein [Candidatus Paceibacterota bacterium]MCF7857284.1 hypothetical protein [Candidatus Paceibacterota bacterium]